MRLFDLFRRKKSVTVQADESSVAAMHVDAVDLDLLDAEYQRARRLATQRALTYRPTPRPPRVARPSYPSQASTFDPSPSIIATSSYSSPSYSSSCDSGSSSSSSCDSSGGF